MSSPSCKNCVDVIVQRASRAASLTFLLTSMPIYLVNMQRPLLIGIGVDINSPYNCPICKIGIQAGGGEFYILLISWFWVPGISDNLIPFARTKGRKGD